MLAEQVRQRAKERLINHGDANLPDAFDAPPRGGHGQRAARGRLAG